MSECMKCKRKLTSDEIGLYRKIKNRNADEFMCSTCFADYLCVDENKLAEKIEQFKKMGCHLFVSD